MSEPAPRLVLLTPHGVDAASADTVRDGLDAACASGAVAAVVLRLAPGDERGLVNLVKHIAPCARRHEAYLLVSLPEPVTDAVDIVAVGSRGGANGVHVERADEMDLSDLRSRTRAGVLGCGGVVETKHAAMTAGEAEVDYVLFGGLDAGGAAPDHELVRERAEWWVPIFETQCVAVAVQADEIAALAATGADFIGLESAIWLGRPQAVADALARIAQGDGTH